MNRGPDQTQLYPTRMRIKKASIVHPFQPHSTGHVLGENGRGCRFGNGHYAPHERANQDEH